MPWQRALVDHPALARLLCEALAGRPELSRAELCEPRADGERLALGLSLVVLPDAAGRIAGAALVFRDLAPIERSGERERLQQRLAALGEMAAGLAHELRNPLAGMEVLAGLLQRRLAGDPDALALVVDLRGQLRQLSDTVTASLDYLRPVALRCEPIGVIDWAEESLALALARAPRPHRIERHFAASLPKIEADRQLLGVALVNLIVNACEAMEGRSGARLSLAIEVAPAPEIADPVRVGREAVAGAARELRIAVGDTGPGIPEAIRDRIFDPFFTTRERGSGIGLASTHKIVLAHGGSLSLSTSERGSEFRIHLPLSAEPA
jgi:signal transduction histidine kinase